MNFRKGCPKKGTTQSRRNSLFHKHEIDREDKAGECCNVIPLQGLSFEYEQGKEGEDGKCYYFLNHLQLHQGERPSVVDEANPVGRNLGAVFE